MTDTSEAAELPPNQTNGDTAPDAAAILLDEEERARMRPADIDADVREMERRKRVELIMNSKMFREELERIIETQLKDGSGTASGLMQQISDMMGMSKHQAGGGNVFKNSNCVVPINDIRGIEAMAYAKGEKILRCKLAAVYRLIDLYGWAQTLTNTLVTARLNQDEEHFLVNPYGMMFHEITASSLLKVDMQGSVIEQGTTNFGLNMAAFSLHAAVHAARPDLRCIINLHVPSVVAVSALKHGILPLSQESVVIGEVSNHTYLGAGLLDPEEKDKLARNLGPNNKVLMLSNQGALCCGATIEEAFFNARNTVLACESQLKLIPIGLDNLNLLTDEQRKKIYEAAHRAPESSPRPDQPSILEGKVERKWRVGGAEFEALMRMLDNAGFRTGYIYRHPLVKGEPPRPKNDVEVPPAVSSLGYLLEEEELYRQGLWRKLEGGRKGHDRSRWLNSPNVYQKVEILETGTPDPKKITKWVAEASPTHSSSTPVKIESALQFVPKGTNPKEFKQKQQQIKDYRRADKISAGPQSHILEGVTWEEAQKMQDATVTQTGDQVVLMGAASKGIIQRGHQHNAMVYKSPYAKNPFDCITDEELDEYKKVVEKKSKGDYDTDFSESEGLSSSAPITNSNKRVTAGGDNIRSPTSITSETEEESRDEPQILRIETKTAPRPSQPEVVLSDAIEATASARAVSPSTTQQFLEAERSAVNNGREKNRGNLRPPPPPNPTLLHCYPQHYQAEQRHLVAQHLNTKKPIYRPFFHHSNRCFAADTATGNCSNSNCQNYHGYYRTNSHLGLPKGSYAVPNPQHFHVVRHSRVAQPQRPVLVKITKKMTTSCQQSHHHHGNVNKSALNKVGGHRTKQLKSAVSLTIENSRAVALEISLETVKDFVFPFASALNMLGPRSDVVSSNQACQTSYLTAVDKADSHSNTGNFLKRRCQSSDEDGQRSDFEREILNKLQANLIEDLLKTDDSFTEPSVDFGSEIRLSNDLAHFSAQSADGCTWEIDHEIFKIVDQVPYTSSEISCAQNSPEKSPTVQDYEEKPAVNICISDKCRRNLLDDFSRTPKKFPVPELPEKLDFRGRLATPLGFKTSKFDETFESCYDDRDLPETTEIGDDLATPQTFANSDCTSAQKDRTNEDVQCVSKTTDFGDSLATPQTFCNFDGTPVQENIINNVVRNVPETNNFGDNLATPQTFANLDCTPAEKVCTNEDVQYVPKTTDFGDNLATSQIFDKSVRKDDTNKWILRNFSESNDFFQSLATPHDVEKYDFTRPPQDNESESFFLPDYLQNNVIKDIVTTLQHLEDVEKNQPNSVPWPNFPETEEICNNVATQRQIITEVDVHRASENPESDFPDARGISGDLATLQCVVKDFPSDEEIGFKLATQRQIIPQVNAQRAPENPDSPKFREILEDLATLQSVAKVRQVQEKFRLESIDMDSNNNNKENVDPNWQFSKQDGDRQSDVSEKQDGVDVDLLPQKIPNSDGNLIDSQMSSQYESVCQEMSNVKQNSGDDINLQSDIPERKDGGVSNIDVSSQEIQNSDRSLTDRDELEKQDGLVDSEMSSQYESVCQEMSNVKQYSGDEASPRSDISEKQDGGVSNIDVSSQEIPNSDENLTDRDEPEKQVGFVDVDSEMSSQYESACQEMSNVKQDSGDEVSPPQSDISEKQDGAVFDIDVSSRKIPNSAGILTICDEPENPDGVVDIDSQMSSPYESACQEMSNVKQDGGVFDIDVSSHKKRNSDENLTDRDELEKQDGLVDSEMSSQYESACQEMSNVKQDSGDEASPRSDISEKQDGGVSNIDVSSQKIPNSDENLTDRDELEKQDGFVDVDSEMSSQYVSACQEMSNVKQDSGDEPSQEDSEYLSAVFQTENDEARHGVDSNCALQIAENAIKVDDETSKFGNDEIQKIDDEIIQQRCVESISETQIVLCPKQKPDMDDETAESNDEMQGNNDEIQEDNDETQGNDDESSQYQSTCQNLEEHQQDQVASCQQQDANLPEIVISHDDEQQPLNNDELFLEHIIELNEILRESELEALRMQNVRRIRANEIIINEIDFLEDAFKMNDELQEANRKLDEELGPSSSLRFYRIAFGDDAELAEDDIADYNISESDEHIDELLGNVTVHHARSDSSSENDEQQSDESGSETKQNDETSHDLFQSDQDSDLDDLLAENFKYFVRISDELSNWDLLSSAEPLQKPDDEAEEVKVNLTQNSQNDEPDDEPSTNFYAAVTDDEQKPNLSPENSTQNSQNDEPQTSFCAAVKSDDEAQEVNFTQNSRNDEPDNEPSTNFHSAVTDDEQKSNLSAENSTQNPRNDELQTNFCAAVKSDDEAQEVNFTQNSQNDEPDNEPSTNFYSAVTDDELKSNLSPENSTQNPQNDELQTNFCAAVKFDDETQQGLYDELKLNLGPEMNQLKTAAAENQANCARTKTDDPNSDFCRDEMMKNDEINDETAGVREVVKCGNDLSKSSMKVGHFDNPSSDEMPLEFDKVVVHHTETNDAPEHDEIILLSSTKVETSSSLDDNTYYSFDDELFDEFLRTRQNLTVQDADDSSSSSSDSDVMYNIFQGIPTQNDEEIPPNNNGVSNVVESPSSRDEGFENDTKLSETSKTKPVKRHENLDSRVIELARIIHQFIEEQCYEVGELMLFPEIANDLSTQKLLAKLLTEYENLYGNTLTDQEKNELRLDICACCLNLVENDEKFVNSFNSNSEIISDKLFSVSEFLSELADHFFGQLDTRRVVTAAVIIGSPDFNSFDRRAKSNVNSHSTPTKTVKDSSFGGNKTDKVTAVNKTSNVRIDSRSPGKKTAEQVTTFKKDESKKSGNEAYWFSISNSPVDGLQKTALPASRKVVKNVDDIPLPLPVDLQQTKQINKTLSFDGKQSTDFFDSRHLLSYSFDRNLSPIQEEARSNLFVDFDSEIVWPAAAMTTEVEETNSPDSEANLTGKKLLRERLVEVLRSDVVVDGKNSPEKEPDSEADFERRNSLRTKLVEVLNSLRETKVGFHEENSLDDKFERGNSPDDEFERKKSPGDNLGKENSPDEKFDEKNSPNDEFERKKSPEGNLEESNSLDEKFEGKISPDEVFAGKNSPGGEFDGKNPPDRDLKEQNSPDGDLEEKNSPDGVFDAKNSLEDKLDRKTSQDGNLKEKNSPDDKFEGKISPDEVFAGKNSPGGEFDGKNSRDMNVEERNSPDGDLEEKNSPDGVFDGKNSLEDKSDSETSQDENLKEKNSPDDKFDERNSPNEEYMETLNFPDAELFQTGTQDRNSLLAGGDSSEINDSCHFERQTSENHDDTRKTIIASRSSKILMAQSVTFNRSVANFPPKTSDSVANSATTTSSHSFSSTVTIVTTNQDGGRETQTKTNSNVQDGRQSLFSSGVAMATTKKNGRRRRKQKRNNSRVQDGGATLAATLQNGGQGEQMTSEIQDGGRLEQTRTISGEIQNGGQDEGDWMGYELAKF